MDRISHSTARLEVGEGFGVVMAEKVFARGARFEPPARGHLREGLDHRYQ